MRKRFRDGLIVIVFWLIVWAILDLCIREDVALFAGPDETFRVYINNLDNPDFWKAIWYTFAGLGGGYLMAVVIATVLGYRAFFSPWLRSLLSPFLGFFGYIPMISFTVAALLWYKGDNLFIPVSLFLSIPVIYKNTLIALDKADQKYIEKMKALNLPFSKKVAYMYRPALMPEYIQGCHRGLSMCWKSGIIAQYLHNKGLSIGVFLYTAKENGDMAGIFAWTIIIVVMTIVFEFIVLELLSSDYINHSSVRIGDLYGIVDGEEEV